MLSFTYRLLTDLGAPIISFYLMRRRAQGREDKLRFPERLGHASKPRPNGQLVWCHAASVGEAASLLALIDKIHDIYPTTHLLVTTGTVTSARMLEGRLPSHVIHQYVPVDRMAYVKRFLNHWQPNLALWIESELWPNMLTALRRRKVPAILLNGRMSEKSFRNWRKVSGWAQTILSSFALCLTQTEEARTRFVALGADPVRCFGNLKYAAQPLPCDDRKLNALRQETQNRTLWVMAQTHRGEEPIALETHRHLKTKWPDLLTIIVPRHAVRGDEIAQQIEASGLNFARRSQHQPLQKETDIYLADTMGELGLFYRLVNIVCIGGSFVPTGGHNPIEPAQLACALIAGPHMHNFSEVTHEFVSNKAMLHLKHKNELVFTITRLLEAPDERERYGQAAHLLADQKRHILDQILEALKPWLSTTSKRGA